MYKTIPWAAPPATFMHYICHHSPVCYSQRAVTFLKKSGRRKLPIEAYFRLHTAQWAGEQEGGTSEHRAWAGVPAASPPPPLAAVRRVSQGRNMWHCLQAGGAWRAILRVLSAWGDRKALGWTLRGWPNTAAGFGGWCCSAGSLRAQPGTFLCPPVVREVGVPSSAVLACWQSRCLCLTPRRATAATWTWGSVAAAKTPAGRECPCHPTAPGAPRTPPSPTPRVGV